jgi:hypothetical protein
MFGRGERLQHAAVVERGERRIEPDDQRAGCLFQQQAIGELFGCPRP